MTTTPIALDARSLFKAAYENRYTWDLNFPGFTADLTLTTHGETHVGKVQVNADLSYEVLEVEDEKVLEQLKGFVWEVVTHRRRTDFDRAHGKNQFSLGNTDETGAVEILVQGDAMGSNYKVRNNEICEVSRAMNGNAFVIHHKDSLNTEAGYISTGYDIVFRDLESNAIIRQQEVELTYEKMGDYYMLVREVVRGSEGDQAIAKEAVFSNITLL